MSQCKRIVINFNIHVFGESTHCGNLNISHISVEIEAGIFLLRVIISFVHGHIDSSDVDLRRLGKLTIRLKRASLIGVILVDNISFIRLEFTQADQNNVTL